jgi:hypothetical protein
MRGVLGEGVALRSVDLVPGVDPVRAATVTVRRRHDDPERPLELRVINSDGTSTVVELTGPQVEQLAAQIERRRA